MTTKPVPYKLRLVIPCFGDPFDCTRPPKEIAGLNSEFLPGVLAITKVFKEIGIHDISHHLCGGRPNKEGHLECERTARWLLDFHHTELAHPKPQLVQVPDVYGRAGIALYAANLLREDDENANSETPSKTLLLSKMNNLIGMAMLLNIGYYTEVENWEKMEQYVYGIRCPDASYGPQRDSILYDNLQGLQAEAAREAEPYIKS